MSAKTMGFFTIKKYGTKDKSCSSVSIFKSCVCVVIIYHHVLCSSIRSLSLHSFYIDLSSLHSHFSSSTHTSVYLTYLSLYVYIFLCIYFVNGCQRRCRVLYIYIFCESARFLTIVTREFRFYFIIILQQIIFFAFSVNWNDKSFWSLCTQRAKKKTVEERKLRE